MNKINYLIKMILIVITVIISQMCLAQFQQFQSQPFQQQRFNQQQRFDQVQQFDQQQFLQPAFQQRQQQQQQFDQSQFNDIGNRQFERLSAVPCPEKTGRFEVPNQCDAYVECIDGVGEQKLCPEGLVFNPEARFNYPCGYPIDINCEGRPNLQAAQPTDDCPHQHGYFKIGDNANCGQFIKCVDGVGHHFDCPEGLAFNSDTYNCDWPDLTSDCDAEAYLKFTCPTSNFESNQFFASETKFFRNPNDCQRYFICVNGRPRVQNCGEGNAFNELINACDAAENVTGCSGSNFAFNDQFNAGPTPILREARQRNRFQQF